MVASSWSRSFLRAFVPFVSLSLSLCLVSSLRVACLHTLIMRNEPPITINHRRKRNETAAAASRAKKTLKYRRVAVWTNEQNKERKNETQVAKKRIPSLSQSKEIPIGVKQARCRYCDKTLISQFALINSGPGNVSCHGCFGNLLHQSCSNSH